MEIVSEDQVMKTGKFRYIKKKVTFVPFRRDNRHQLPGPEAWSRCLLVRLDVRCTPDCARLLGLWESPWRRPFHGKSLRTRLFLPGVLSR